MSFLVEIADEEYKNKNKFIEIIKTVSGKIPLMGVCLGHQSIAVAFGATVSNAKELFHGKSSMADHNGKGIFKGLPNPLQVARYHSLSIVPSTVPDCLEVTATVGDEISSVDDATQSVISTMKAFGIEADNAISIVDKYNEVDILAS